MDAGQIRSVTCYRHPQRETYVRCARCNRPICPDCMHQASVGFQCPECVRAGRRSVRQATGRFGGGVVGKREYVTFGIIALNVAVFALDAILTSGKSLAGFGLGGGNGISPVQLWAGMLGYVGPYDGGQYAGVAAGEYYRLISAAFVHFGLLHIALNMWAVYILGRYLERTLGHVRFGALYLVSAIGGNTAVYLFSPAEQISAGASTAVFGLFVAVFFINRKLGRETTSIVVLLAINVMATFWIPSISIAGHIGGLATGALASVALAYAPKSQRTAVQAGAFVVLLAVMAVLVLGRTQGLVGA